MKAQNQILRTVRALESALSETLAQHRYKSRSAIGRIVCDESGFHDVRGERQWAGCMKALGTLEAEHRIVLRAAPHLIHPSS